MHRAGGRAAGGEPICRSRACGLVFWVCVAMARPFCLSRPGWVLGYAELSVRESPEASPQVTVVAVVGLPRTCGKPMTSRLSFRCTPVRMQYQQALSLASEYPTAMKKVINSTQSFACSPTRKKKRIIEPGPD
jgi:hypothetical protein